MRKTYALESATSFAGTNWLPVVVFSGDGAFQTGTDPNADSARSFYRVRVQ